MSIKVIMILAVLQLTTAQATTQLSGSGDANLIMQVIIVIGVAFQIFSGWMGKREERRREEVARLREEQNRKWAEEDRQRLADEAKRVAKEEADRLAQIARDTKQEIMEGLRENTEITRKNPYVEEIFGKLLASIPVATTGRVEGVHAGGQERTQTADTAPPQ